jgi:hypothetical protein
VPENNDEHAWFKRFMGMPGDPRREKIELVLGIVIGVALIAFAVWVAS